MKKKEKRKTTYAVMHMDQSISVLYSRDTQETVPNQCSKLFDISHLLF